MKFDELLEKPLKELLDEYALLYNLECGYYYGICDLDTIDLMFQEYNVEEYEDAMYIDTLIPESVLQNIDDETLTYEKIQKIMSNLGITKRTKHGHI